MSVKLASWAEPLKITPNHPDVVERNARYLARLYHEAQIKEPPIMEWTFLANVMQAYTGNNNQTLFSHAACMESKQHMLWIHYLREPFSAKADDSAVHRYTLFFAHGTNTAGAEGITNKSRTAVVSNRFTRDLRIDGMDIFDVRLAQVMTGVLDQDFADPLETVQTFERTDQALFLEECKVDNYKMATINSWISHRVGKEKMPKVRNASDELLAAIGRVPPGNRPAIDAIAVGWGLSVTAAAKIGERSLCNLIAAATCCVLGQENGTARIIQHLRQDFESRHPELQVYHWAFQWNKGLPTARILPKGSKQFSKARPIVTYTRCWHTKASSFLATALYSIMQILFPSGSTLNVNSVLHALQLARRHLQNMDPDDEEQVMIQQDLIGFFNSVPHSRICSALQLMTYRLQEHFGQPIEDLTFQTWANRRRQCGAILRAGWHPGDAFAEEVAPKLPEDSGAYSDLGTHREMIEDRVRTEAFREAIFRTCKDKIVLEVGCGTGILSVFAAQAGQHGDGRPGPRSAVEEVASVVDEVLAGDKADVVLSEWMGFMLVCEDMFPSVAFARDRWLAEGGIMLPACCSLHVAPFSHVSLVERQTGFWATSPFGVDLSPLAFHALDQHVLQPVIDTLQAEAVLGDCTKLFTLNCKEASAADSKAGCGTFVMTITRPGRLHGLAVWFSCELCSGVRFCTAPEAASTHWEQTLLFFDPASEVMELEVSMGDKIEGELRWLVEGRDLGVVMTGEVSTTLDSEISTLKFGRRLVLNVM
eukprot:s1132_g7.t2